MDISLKRILGLEDEGKRTYRFVSGEVTREEYEYCQLLDTLLFGTGGYVETLGPTWGMIHDPRFTKIENAFIVNRRAVFGGDAMVGKQYISSDGHFTSTIADLEQYAETLGEGRFFYTIITHPNKACPKRNWLLRIFPEMVEKEGLEVPAASEDLKCTCDNLFSSGGLICDPRKVKDWDEEMLWNLIKGECPNYFNKEGKPNGIATRLHDLFQADLLGLIADYAVTPLSDAFIELDTGDVIGQQVYADQYGFVPNVFLEVDILEKALTQRAVLRATAAKILRQMGFHKTIKEELGGDVRLTDIERDQLLRLIYTPKPIAGITFDPGSNWFGYLQAVRTEVTQFVKDIRAQGKSFEQREDEQLDIASLKAGRTFAALETGKLKPINQYTEPEVDVPLDQHAQILEKILKDPIRQELFLMWVDAERRGNDDNPSEWDRLNMRKLHSILTPIFTDADFPLDEDRCSEYQQQAEDLGFYIPALVQQVEEEYHADSKKIDFHTS